MAPAWIITREQALDQELVQKKGDKLAKIRWESEWVLPPSEIELVKTLSEIGWVSRAKLWGTQLKLLLEILLVAGTVFLILLTVHL